MYSFLAHICKEEAQARVCVSMVPDEHGFEAWRLLCKAKLPRSATAAVSSLANPESEQTRCNGQCVGAVQQYDDS